LSYFVGQKHMPIKYDMKSIGIYTLTALVLFATSYLINTSYLALDLLLKSVLLIAFLTLVVKRDFPLNKIPYINKFIK